MTISKAIKKAIEGGWRPDWLEEGDIINFWDVDYHYGEHTKNHYIVFLDLLFWQALGKAMGWGGRESIGREIMLWIKCNQKEINPEKFKELIHVSFDVFYRVHKREIKKALLEMRRRNMAKNKDVWKKEWHHLIDHLAEGKDIESFFKELK